MMIANTILAGAALCALAFYILRFWFDQSESAIISVIVTAVALVMFWLVGSGADYLASAPAPNVSSCPDARADTVCPSLNLHHARRRG
jgi:hypothetical protein